MLAYRAEDIHQRLEPQELYMREELEESVQYDVAEDCILKWLQRFVKPVIIRQEKHRRQTVGLKYSVVLYHKLHIKHPWVTFLKAALKERVSL